MFVPNRNTLISLILTVALSFLIGGCSSSAEAPPPTSATEEAIEVLPSPTEHAESPTVAAQVPPTETPTPTSNQAGDSLAKNVTPTTEAAEEPASTPEPAAITIPELTENQTIVFENTVSGILTSALANRDILDEGALEPVAGAFIIMTTLSPNYVDYMSNATPDFDKKIQPLIDFVNGLSQAEKNSYVAQALEDFGLQSGSPALLNISYLETMAEYDPVTGTSTLTVAIPDIQGLEPLDGLTLQEAAEDRIQVNAITINSRTLEAESATLSVSNVTLETDDSNILWGTLHTLSFTVPGTLVKWSKIRLPAGVVVGGNQPELQGYILYTKGLPAVDTIMASRALEPGAQGRNYITPNTYGAPEPYPLPAIPASDMEMAMYQRLDYNLALAVEAGDITQEEANTLLDRYDDPDITAVASHPIFRAALMIASTIKDAGGDMLLDVLLGNNPTGQPIRMMFEDDPQVQDIFGDDLPWPPLGDDSGILAPAPDGSQVLVMSQNLKNGIEPVELFAGLMLHEVIPHDSPNDSIDEELVGNLLEIYAWARLAERNPSLLTAGNQQWNSNTQSWEVTNPRQTGTRWVQFNNLLLLILLNSQNPAGAEGLVAGRHTGVLSQHAPEGYNTLPGNSVGTIRSFMDFIQNVSYANAEERGIKLDPTSVGGENFRRLLKTMFGDDIQIGQLDVHSDPNQAPDFSELSTQFIDQNLHRWFTNDFAVKIARLMKLELGGGSR